MIKKTLFWSVLAVILGTLAMGLYEQVTATNKAKRLLCQEKVTVFEHIYKVEYISKIQKAIKQKSLNLNIRYQESTHMTSVLFERISKKEINQMFSKTFFETPNDEVNIDILVYENDKKDPGKKSPKAFLYAGYFAVDFSYKGELVYKIQVDFMDENGSDMQERIECIKKSVLSLS